MCNDKVMKLLLCLAACFPTINLKWESFQQKQLRIFTWKDGKEEKKVSYFLEKTSIIERNNERHSKSFFFFFESIAKSTFSNTRTEQLPEDYRNSICIELRTKIGKARSEHGAHKCLIYSAIVMNYDCSMMVRFHTMCM